MKNIQDRCKTDDVSRGPEVREGCIAPEAGGYGNLSLLASSAKEFNDRYSLNNVRGHKAEQ